MKISFGLKSQVIKAYQDIKLLHIRVKVLCHFDLKASTVMKILTLAAVLIVGLHALNSGIYDNKTYFSTIFKTD